MAGEKNDEKKAEEKKQRADSWFEKVQNWISDSIRGFAAAIFILFGFGTIYGWFFYANPFMLLLPFLLGLLAYYSRDFAVVVLVVIVLGVVLVLV